MLTAVTFVPTPPLLVPELANGASAQTRDLREACLSVVQLLAATSRSWTAIGVGAVDRQLDPSDYGSWRSFGVDVAVSLAPMPADRAHPVPAELPLPALIAGWLRQQVAPDADVHVQLYARDTTPSHCLEVGRQLGADPQSHALLVLGDGCTTLTEKAPGAFDARAGALQNRIDDALATADVAALAALDPELCEQLGVSGRVAWQVAAGAAGTGWRGQSWYAGAPFGVGYQVAAWQR